MLLLEGFQAGLSWITIFEKREKISDKPLIILTIPKSPLTTKLNLKNYFITRELSVTD